MHTDIILEYGWDFSLNYDEVDVLEQCFYNTKEKVLDRLSNVLYDCCFSNEFCEATGLTTQIFRSFLSYDYCSAHTNGFDFKFNIDWTEFYNGKIKSLIKTEHYNEIIQTQPTCRDIEKDFLNSLLEGFYIYEPIYNEINDNDVFIESLEGVRELEFDKRVMCEALDCSYREFEITELPDFITSSN